MRDRLIELLVDNCDMRDGRCVVCDKECKDSRFGKIADHLLAEGVIVPRFSVGDEIWVIEREDGEAVDVSSVQYLAEFMNCVIATAFINDYDIDETIEYHIHETQENFDTELQAYPKEDCFPNREEAERALVERREEDGND